MGIWNSFLILYLSRTLYFGLFAGVGMLYVRFHHLDLAFYGGLKERMPLFSMIFMGLMMCAVALFGIAAQLHNIYDALVELRRAVKAAQEGKAS